ncbi:MarR family transcriptional regulator [Mycobacterium sp. CBMA293]|uniref:MarR family transcriptional regulator n=1 Tax=unclassified Mycolicibacterium TaxID=2636767 RepID=UPI0012DE507C|nr:MULTISPECIES: MarR family transcriptional regulator [unclassified Mycolicibacterium]MUL47642.1 MarR family transcriptional regulator [Mycolicibacterium sp. CBMA 360]MUL92870.1 MarR family transcriptional regulator [Mycolicibacterium sp. CBMA 230]MUM32013.1 MarR family transcriptional regulator [Mycolicibacterium sp. CBMA 361]MUL61840.1 MarR family transcriptional regulator [Mycolicibacterium sp. CBMA 335]MUL70904.1 MarR family transcriptional regulator [Mycolicibacterium sp. CBMA 311]
MGEARRAYGVPDCEATWDSVDYLLADWARERPDLDFGPLAVINRMGQVRRKFEQHMAEVFSRHGLTAADFLVIVNLRRAGQPYRLPQSRLMNALGLTSGTVSLRLDRLVKAGIVVREPDPDDRRGSLIRLSDDGLRLFDVVAPEHLANEDRLLSALSGEERETLAGLLRHLLVSLEPPRPAPDSHLGMSVESAHAARGLRSAVGLSDTAGLLLSAVEAGSPAAAAGLQRGDLIVEVGGAPVHNVGGLAATLAGLGEGEAVDLAVLRGDEPHRVVVRQASA